MTIRLKIARLANGERLPLLVKPSGVPLLLPTLYALTQLRARNLAANSIANALRAVGLFDSHLTSRGIDLNSRLKVGEILSLSEIEALVDRFRIRGAVEEEKPVDFSRRRQKIPSAEHYRTALKGSNEEQVSRGWLATRLMYSRNYVVWLAENEILQPGTLEAVRQRLRLARESFVRAIDSRMPTASESQNPRQGLAEEEINTIEDAIRPQSPRNPWKEEHAKVRNHAMITLFKALGSRRGEIAGLEIPDVNFRTGKITILRKPDNPTDPRRDQPNTKTLAIEQELTRDTLDVLESYVLEHRSKIPGARRHKVIFVASDTGRPLSNPAINKVFRGLRDGCLGPKSDLSPHILRHTWNDAFSKLCDEKNIPPELEEKFRSRSMGWVEGSGTARKYTKRHVAREAQKLSLELQKRLGNPTRK